MTRRIQVRIGSDAGPAARSVGGLSRRAALAAAAAVGGAGLLAATAYAGDQVLTGSIAEQIVGDTNYQLDPGDEGTIGSETSLNLAYRNSTPAEALNLRGGIRYAAFTGDANDNIAGLFPNLRGDFRRERSDRALTFNFSGAVTPVELSSTSFVLLPTDPDADPDAPPQVGLVNSNDQTLRASMLLGAGYEYDVNSTESLQFNASASRIDFLDDTGGRYSASSTFDVSAGWSHRVSSSWTTGVSTGVTDILTDDSSDRDTITVFVAPTLGYARTPNQTFDVSLGPSLSFISGGRRDSEIQPGIRASIGAKYVEGPNSFSAGISNSTLPSDEGVSSNVTSLSASLGRRIDETQSLQASVSASLQTPLDDAASSDEITRYSLRGGYTLKVTPRTSGQAGLAAAYTDDSSGSETAYSVNAGLSYLLTEETTANLGYVFRINDSEDAATSHRVTFSLRRNFSLLP